MRAVLLGPREHRRLQLRWVDWDEIFCFSKVEDKLTELLVQEGTPRLPSVPAEWEDGFDVIQYRWRVRLDDLIS